MQKGVWAELAVTGAEFALRVTPRARREDIVREESGRDGATFRATVFAPPEDGKANAAVQALLAHALGVARTRLTLVRGATSRDKVFRLDV